MRVRQLNLSTIVPGSTQTNTWSSYFGDYDVKRNDGTIDSADAVGG